MIDESKPNQPDFVHIRFKGHSGAQLPPNEQDQIYQKEVSIFEVNKHLKTLLELSPNTSLVLVHENFAPSLSTTLEQLSAFYSDNLTWIGPQHCFGHLLLNYYQTDSWAKYESRFVLPIFSINFGSGSMNFNYEQFQTYYLGHLVRWQGILRFISNDRYDVEITSDGKPIGQNARALFQVPHELQSTYYQYSLDQQPREICGQITSLQQSEPYLILTATFPREPTQSTSCESIINSLIVQPQTIQLTVLVKYALQTEQIGDPGMGQTYYYFLIDISQSSNPTWNNSQARLCVSGQSPALNSFYQLSQSPAPNYVLINCTLLNYTEQEGYTFFFQDFAPQQGVMQQQNPNFAYQEQQYPPQEQQNDEPVYSVTCTLSPNVDDVPSNDSTVVRYIPITILDADAAFRSRFCVNGKMHYIVVFGGTPPDQHTRILINNQQSCQMSLQLNTYNDTAFYFLIIDNITETVPNGSVYQQSQSNRGSSPGRISPTLAQTAIQNPQFGMMQQTYNQQISQPQGSPTVYNLPLSQPQLNQQFVQNYQQPYQPQQHVSPPPPSLFSTYAQNSQAEFYVGGQQLQNQNNPTAQMQQTQPQFPQTQQFLQTQQQFPQTQQFQQTQPQLQQTQPSYQLGQSPIQQTQPQNQLTQSGGSSEVLPKWLDPLDGKLMTLPVYGADKKLYHEPTLSAYLEAHQGIGPNGKKWMTKFFLCQSIANDVEAFLKQHPDHPLRR
ncbi:hypothetical protein BLNAU_10358 [Blattamonas nauphoetae]|uniref:Uncharacterized protein n=1 Tax=Blattamonas nauphoetae TaxID=2049346 RepID=A0ABQ9XT98_9EUKA|nr:hypothetical protein BLNAU_10358 [Blattamonas nauphoetae]